MRRVPSKYAGQMWRVCRYPGLQKYMISTDGKVRRVSPGKTRKHTPPSGCIDMQGYVKHTLMTDDGKSKSIKAHVLVAWTWRGDPPTPKHEVAHNNGIRHQNNFENLRWATRKENHDDMLLHGTSVIGTANGRARLTVAKVRRIKRFAKRREKKFGDVAKLARELGIGWSTVYDIARDHTWRHISA